MFSDAAVVAGLSFPFCDLFLCDVVSSCFRHVVVEGPFWVRRRQGVARAVLLVCVSLLRLEIVRSLRDSS